jgi:cytochrome P450
MRACRPYVKKASSMTAIRQAMEFVRRALFRLSVQGLDPEARWYRSLLFNGHFYDVVTPEDYRLMDRHAKVHYFRKDEVWLVTGFDEVERALNSDRIFTTKDVEDFKLFDPTGILIRAEQERHEEVFSIFRDCLMSYKQPEYISSFRDRLEGLVNETGKSDILDFKKEVTEKLVVRTYGYLLGLSDRDTRLVEENFDDVDIMKTVHWLDAQLRRTGISGYGAARAGSIIPALQAAISKGEITEEEGLNIIKFFLVASTENMSTIFQRIFQIIVSDVGLRRRLSVSTQEHPKFIEEVIRLYPPFPWLNRFCVQENELLGTVIPAGATLLLDVRGANRSSSKFDHPDRMSLEENKHRHLGFGSGLHKCVGMGMARAQSRLFLEYFLEKAVEYEILEMEWQRLDIVNNLKTRTMKVLRRVASHAV